jgi:hypothetical protein
MKESKVRISKVIVWKGEYLIGDIFSVCLMQVVMLDGAMFILVWMGGEVTGCTLLPDVVRRMFHRMRLGEVPVFRPHSHTNVRL